MKPFPNGRERIELFPGLFPALPKCLRAHLYWKEVGDESSGFSNNHHRSEPDVLHFLLYDKRLFRVGSKNHKDRCEELGLDGERDRLFKYGGSSSSNPR